MKIKHKRKAIYLNDGSEISIREGEERDAESLLRLLKSTLEDGDGMVLEDGEKTMTLDEEKAWIQGMKQHPNEILLVADFKGEVIGNLDFHIGRRNRLCHRGIFGLSVHPEWRDKGIGTALVDGLIKWAETRPSIKKISLGVLSTNDRAIALYEKFGFVEEGRRIGEIMLSKGSYIDDILMYRWIGEKAHD